MKFLYALILVSAIGIAQPNTEVYLLDLDYQNKMVTNSINISNNEGYDNQPYFANDSLLFFTKTRDSLTDIADYDLVMKTSHWKSDTNYGSEYSPIQIPENTELATIRLDTTGLQRLYLYNESKRFMQPIHDTLVIGYHAWLNASEVITFVLGDESSLVYIDLATMETKEITRNIGRSLHKVPESQLMSYTTINEDGNHDVYLLDIKDDFKSFFVCQLPIGVQDYTWLNRDVLLLGSGNTLYTYDTFVDEDWQKLASLKEFGLTYITRLGVSPNGKKLAVVVEEE